MPPEPLAQRRCVPCEKGTPPIEPAEAERLSRELGNWELAERKRLSRIIRCKDFASAVALIGKIADIAEAEDHHPDLHLTGYRNLAIELSTHSIGGLSENDFIIAAKIDKLLPSVDGLLKAR